MKKEILLILFFLPLMLFAQEKKMYEFSRFRLGIEAGSDMFNGQTVKNINIRESQSYYYNFNYYDDLYNCGFMYDSYNYTRYYFGFKPEYSLSLRLAVAAGVRFSFNKSEFYSDKSYFLWKINEENLTTNYVRVSGIDQNNFYVGVPIEVKYFTGSSDLFVRQYFKAGMLFNFLASSKSSVHFLNEKMNKYEDNIRGQIGKPSSLSGYLYLGFGLKIGRMKNPFGTVEIQAPIRVFKNKNLSSFTKEPEAGFGVQTTLYIPSGKKKLGYPYR